MIPLTRQDGSAFLVNPDRIETVEETPDTVLTLVTGEKLVVRESARAVMDLIIDFRRSLLMPLAATSTVMQPPKSEPEQDSKV